MIAVYAIGALGAVVVAVLSIGLMVGIVLLVGLIALIVASCVVLGEVVGGAVGTLGTGRRRAADVPFWMPR